MVFALLIIPQHYTKRKRKRKKKLIFVVLSDVRVLLRGFPISFYFLFYFFLFVYVFGGVDDALHFLNSKSNISR